MNILIVGNQQQQAEFNTKFSHLGSDNIALANSLVEPQAEAVHAIFDFTIDQAPEVFQKYHKLSPSKVVFSHTVKHSLNALCAQYGKPACSIFGFNGLPAFFDKPQLELTAGPDVPTDQLTAIMAFLKAEYLLVHDRVGMVSPRPIVMVINEAYYTLQEGTANKADIDKGMKLGTGYPHGPFEWCSLIGIEHVYQLLEALWHDTKEERYKICPLLKQEYYQQLMTTG